MKNDKDELFGCFGKVVLFVGTLVLLAVMRGLVISEFWQWFIMPIFPVAKISIIQAIGLSLTIGYFTGTESREEAKDEKGLWELLGALLIAPIVVYGIGFIIHQFM